MRKTLKKLLTIKTNNSCHAYLARSKISRVFEVIQKRTRKLSLAKLPLIFAHCRTKH